MKRLSRLVVRVFAVAGCIGWLFAPVVAAQGIALRFDPPSGWTLLDQDAIAMQFGSPAGDRLLVGNLSDVSCAEALALALRLTGGTIVDLDIESFPDGAVTYASVARGRSWRGSIATSCRSGHVAVVVADHAGPRSEAATLAAANRVLHSLRVAPAPQAAAQPQAAPPSPATPRRPAVGTDEFQAGIRAYDTFRSTMNIWYGR
jgi:hypothetical protein